MCALHFLSLEDHLICNYLLVCHSILIKLRCLVFFRRVELLFMFLWIFLLFLTHVIYLVISRKYYKIGQENLRFF